MQLRPYQDSFVSAVQKDFADGMRRVLGVAATGSGKTVMAAELIKRMGKKTLFIADAKELVWQAADKIQKWTGQIVDIEMGDRQASPFSQVVVATSQSLARRLDKYAENDFDLIINDEAHRNTFGLYPSKIFNFFKSAKVLGITATPYRSDKKELGSFYEKISSEISLISLIAHGYLANVRIKSIPIGIDLRDVRKTAGDYNDADLGLALDPHLMRCAQLLKDNAYNRKTVVFLPLIETSKRFCECCNQIGLHAVHVDGIDRAAMRSDYQVICNASLLTTGWDEPSIDCVYILRPTMSQVLYSQMVGRGTRICEGKENLLLLDPLFLSDNLSLVRPARLVAASEDEFKAIQTRLDLGEKDLMQAQYNGKKDLHASMLEKLAAQRRRKERITDAIEFAVSMERDDILDYEPTCYWEKQSITPKQRELLLKAGIDAEAQGMCKGLACKLIDVIMQRWQLGLATYRMVKLMQKFRVPNAHLKTFEEAKEILNECMSR